MATASISHDQVLKVLSTVQDPDLGSDLVTLKMIQDLEISDKGVVKLRVVLTTPACPMKEKIKSDVEGALRSIGVVEMEIKMDAQVKARTPNASSPGAQSIPGVAHVIAVSSGKGGVGKSTVAVNLAISLARQGAKVGIMDADVYGPNIPTMMGVTERPTIEVTQGKEFFIPPVAQNVKVMSMGFLIEPNQPLVWRGPMLHSVVTQFCHQVNWGDLDYLIVDMPPGTGDIQLSLAQLVPVSGAVLVTTPQEVSLQDVRRAYSMFEKVRIPVLGVVENMSYFQDPAGIKHHLFGKDGGKLLAKKLNTPFLGEVPLIQAVREGGDQGRPVSATDVSPEAREAFLGLTGQVVRELARVLNSSAGAAVEIGAF